jgi:hypothetical protein
MSIGEVINMPVHTERMTELEDHERLLAFVKTGQHAGRLTGLEIVARNVAPTHAHMHTCGHT